MTVLRTSARLAALEGYAFHELDRMRDERRAAGVDVIDFGVGDPTEPTPEIVVEAARASLAAHTRSGYPSYHGSELFRGAVATWIEGRYGLAVDPDTMVCSTVGSKEAIFHLPQAFVDPGDVVLLPSPGYPPYGRGTRFVGGRPMTYAVHAEGPLLPDLDRLDAALGGRLALVWITQPHVPTGRAASLPELRRLAAQCRARGALLCSDEAYSELWFDEPPASALQTGVEGVLVFQSLSKRSAMTGYRIGFVVGDPRAVAAFRTLKMNIDSGSAHFVQDAAVAALADEEGPDVARQSYRERIDVLLPALSARGCAVRRPAAGLYLWVGAPEGLSGLRFARALLQGSPALAVMPGAWLCDALEGESSSPGEGHVRFALVPSTARCREARERLLRW